MSCLVLTSRKIKIAVVVSAEPFANLLRALVFNCFISIFSIFVVKHFFILPQRYMELIKQWFLLFLAVLFGFLLAYAYH